MSRRFSRLKTFRVLLICVLGWPGITIPARAQLTLDWQPVEALNATLPPSIRVFQANDPTLPLKAWYVRADPSDTTWILTGVLSDDADGLEPVSSFVADADALVGINAGYFGGGTSYSLVVHRGQKRATNLGALNRNGLTFYPTRSAFGMRADGSPDVAWVYEVDGTTYAYPNPSPNEEGAPQPVPTAEFPEGGAPWAVTDAVGGGPVLVEGSRQRITWEEEVFFGSGIGTPEMRNPRTAVGYTADGEVLLLVVDGRQAASRGASLIELAEILLDLGAVEAVNLDGGGSSTMVVGETLVNRPSDGSERAVASALLLMPAPDDEGGGTNSPIVFDTGDACCYREVGEWFESANTPYYGGTPARLFAAGDGSGTATFLLEGIAPGRYVVEAWWVPSFNRATDTPYTVYHQGAGTTVRVDQSNAATLGQWNELGLFDLAPGDSVVVSNDASGTTSPAYVCVDALRLTPVTATAVERPARRPATPTLDLYPNPTRGAVTLRYILNHPGRVSGSVVDVLGRVVYRFDDEGSPGERQLHLDWTAPAPGLYLVRLVTPDGVRQQPLIILP